MNNLRGPNLVIQDLFNEKAKNFLWLEVKERWEKKSGRFEAQEGWNPVTVFEDRRVHEPRNASGSGEQSPGDSQQGNGDLSPTIPCI